MLDPKDHLAATLKLTRQTQGLSLDKTAEKTGVSKAMLGQIERGESSPTVATLWKIATGLGVSLSTFIEPVPETETQTIVRTADHIRQHPGEDGLMIAPLFPFEQAFGFEFLELTFLPGYERISEAHEPGVMEIVSVITGQLDILSDGHWHKLKQGQSIRFAGDRTHGYRNPAKTKAIVHTLIHYPHRS